MTSTPRNEKKSKKKKRNPRLEKKSTPRNDASGRKVNSSELAVIMYISDDQSSEFNLHAHESTSGASQLFAWDGT